MDNFLLLHEVVRDYPEKFVSWLLTRLIKGTTSCYLPTSSGLLYLVDRSSFANASFEEGKIQFEKLQVYKDALISIELAGSFSKETHDEYSSEEKIASIAGGIAKETRNLLVLKSALEVILFSRRERTLRLVASEEHLYLDDQTFEIVSRLYTITGGNPSKAARNSDFKFSETKLDVGKQLRTKTGQHLLAFFIRQDSKDWSFQYKVLLIE